MTAKPEPSDPYRSAALEIVPSHVERAFCPWCSHQRHEFGTDDWRCNAPAKRGACGHLKKTSYANPKGYCTSYQLSLRTRLARVFNRRGPVLIEPEDQ